MESGQGVYHTEGVECVILNIGGEKMLNPAAFAHAATAVTAIFYVGCLILSALAPDVVYSISQSWFHTVSLDSLQNRSAMSLDKIILGLVSISALTWVTTYVTIWLYNYRAKK